MRGFRGTSRKATHPGPRCTGKKKEGRRKEKVIRPERPQGKSGISKGWEAKFLPNSIHLESSESTGKKKRQGSPNEWAGSLHNLPHLRENGDAMFRMNPSSTEKKKNQGLIHGSHSVWNTRKTDGERRGPDSRCRRR